MFFLITHKTRTFVPFMSRRRFTAEQRLLTGVSIVDIAEGGKGVAKVDDLVVFVDKAIPGDVVDVELTRKKKKFAEARVRQIKESSVHRVAPFCEHFGVCGGCKWQHMEYPAQLVYKQNSVDEALTRLGKVDTSMIEAILPAPHTQYYRNKLEYTFSNKRWLTDLDGAHEGLEMRALGFHVPSRFDKILDIEHCYLQQDPSNAIRNTLRSFALEKNISFYDLRQHEGALRNLIIRTASTGELMVIVVFAYPNSETIEAVMAFLQLEFPTITSLLYVVNQKKNDTIFDQDIQ